MGFLGDLINEILDGDGVERFGVYYRDRDKNLKNLYKATYFYLGLPPLRNVKDGQFVPIKSTNWADRVTSFEIRGNILNPTLFLDRGWENPFHRISLNVPTLNNRVWAFDISQLHKSILIAHSVGPNSSDFRRSEESLNILRTVGLAHVGAINSVPQIELQFGEIWDTYAIPDQVFVALNTAYPLRDNQLQRIVDLILHSYNRGDAPPVTADYTVNAVEGTVTIAMRENLAQPNAPEQQQGKAAPQAQNHPPQDTPQESGPGRYATTAGFMEDLDKLVNHQANASQPESQPSEPQKQSDPDDGFPYDFYRGIGLITEHNTVYVPTFFGPEFPVAIPMTSDEAKEFLLNYKPDN